MPLTDSEKELCSFISADKAYEHVQKLTQFGPRDVGSIGDRKSIEYLFQELTQYGIKVRTDICHVGVFTEKESNLRLLGPEKKEISCRAHLRSGPTPKEGVTSELVYVGYGREQDYEGMNVEGKIILSDYGMIDPVPKAENAARRGAVGCIWPNITPGNRVPARGLAQFGAPLPVVGVSYEDGQFLKGLLEKSPVNLWMKVDASVRDGMGEHVVGVLEGSKRPEEFIALLAHRDTVHLNPGANDDASGMAVLLELARVLARCPVERSVMFIFSTAEEGGGIGVREYVVRSKKDMERTLALINIDMVAVGSKLRIVEEGKARYQASQGAREPDKIVKTTSWLNELLRDIARELGYNIGTMTVSGLADTEAFLEVGVPSTWLFKQDDPYNHTQDDTLDKINPNDLKVTADIVGVAVRRLAVAKKKTIS